MTPHSSSPIVAVHGATGTQGAAVARALRAAGYRVRALARRPPVASPLVAETAAVDLLDAGSLAEAYAGADAVFVHLPTAFDPVVVQQHADNVLTALDKSAVRRVVFNPNLALPPVEIGVPYVDARVRLAHGLEGHGRTARVVGPAAQYMENLNAPWSASLVRDDGVLAYPLPVEAAVPWVALDDVAAAVVDALADEHAPTFRLVSGPETVDGAGVAERLGAALGRPVRWQTISAEAYRAMLAPHLGEAAAAGISGIYAAVLSGDAPPPAAPDPAVTRVGATTLTAWAASQPWPHQAG